MNMQMAYFDQWKRFVTDGELGDAVAPLIARSWLRCKPRLNALQAPTWAYLSADILNRLSTRHANLIRLARPIIEDSYEFAEPMPMALLLTDSTNCVLHMHGHPSTLTMLSELGLQTGVFLAESRIGTNAAAVALLEGEPVSICGAQHYLHSLHQLYSAAAPLFTAAGSPLGVISLIAAVELASPALLSLTYNAARLLEHQLHNEVLLSNVHTHIDELNATLDTISDGVLEWNSAGTLTRLNLRGGQMLDLDPPAVLGRPLHAFLALPRRIVQAVERHEELQDIELDFTLKDSVRAFVVSLRITPPTDEITGSYILTLRPIEQVRQLVTRLVGAQARLNLNDIIGRSPQIRRLRHEALAAARVRAPILLIGESGAGKNVLARAIHNNSPRADGPFLAINCRAIPRELALGELLGYDAGRSGAPNDGQPSKFELANGGTLYFDEVDALALDTQAALLRVIEGDEVIRLGGTRVIAVDVRIIASTTQDLQSLVAQTVFRSDLYFRLSAFSLHMPTLRERPEDIPLLIDHALIQIAEQMNAPKPQLSDEALQVLTAYPWPGNTRELEAVLERAAIVSRGQPINLTHLPPHVRERRALIPQSPITEPVRTLQEAEYLAILRAGQATQGRVTQMARLLGIGRTTLWRRLKALDIDVEDFRE